MSPRCGLVVLGASGPGFCVTVTMGVGVSRGTRAFLLGSMVAFIFVFVALLSFLSFFFLDFLDDPPQFPKRKSPKVGIDGHSEVNRTNDSTCDDAVPVWCKKKG